MKIDLYQLDAFADKPFTGNPAAVCPLEDWLPDEVLQSIATENNLSETAFLIRDQRGVYDLRWFTPAAEVDLCGHATLASAHVVLHELDSSLDRVVFRTRSGSLFVEKNEDLLRMDFPSTPPQAVPVPEGLQEAIGILPRELYATDRDYVALLGSQQEVQDLEPNFVKLAKLPREGFMVTARGEQADFVSRFFAPALAVDEDPVTGSAHCALTPFWAGRLKRESLHARQLSPRGGTVHCTLAGDRVFLAGKVFAFMKGTISLPESVLPQAAIS